MGDCLYCGKPIGFEGVWTKWLKPCPVACEVCYALFQRISNWICRKCGRPYRVNWFVDEEMICRDCMQLWQNETLFFGNRSLFSYNEAGQAWMKRFKFRGDTVLAQMFSQELRKICKIYPRRIDAIVPIPLSEMRQQERRFNQSEIIARIINGRKIRHLLLKDEQEKQSKLDKYERLHRGNPFILNENAWEGFSGGTVLLVDDIYTTGATIYQAAQEIWKRTPCQIYSFTLFRS